MNLAITWDVTPEIFEGYKTPNFYGLLFVAGLMIGYFVIKRMYKKDRIDEKYLDKLVLFMIIATVVGARLGHVLFYGPYWDVRNAEGVLIERGYFSDPVSILKVWEGGLASHGGVIAILIALYLYSKKVIRLPMLWILDRIVAPIAIAGCFIRLGNLMNSEIVGVPTDLPWAFSFTNYFNADTGQFDPTPRHPAQLYEAISYILIFALLMFMYWKRRLFMKPGVIFGTFLITLFGARFLVEFVKVGQTARDAYWAINTGQMLSIPLIIAGIVILIRALKKEPKEEGIQHLQADTSIDQ